MNALKLHRGRRFALSVLLLGVCGCSVLKPAQNDGHFYILAPAESTNFGTEAHGRYVVRLQPIDVASYLRTKDIAVRTGTDEIIFADFHQWAEPLNEGVRRVLAENLRRSPAIREVLTDQTPGPGLPVYTFHIEILACEGVRGGTQGSVNFEAVWQVAGPNGAFGQGDFRMKPAFWNGTDYGELARRLSQGIDGMTGKLLDALGKLNVPG